MNTLYVLVFASVRIALQHLVRHRVRSFLTLLGIALGIGAVVSIASLGEGLKEFFAVSVGSSAAPDMLFIMPDVPIDPARLVMAAKPFKNRDVEALQRCPYVAEVIGGNMQQDALIKHGWRSDRTLLANVDTGYFALDRLEPGDGRLFSPAEIHNNALVAVVGGQIRDKVYAPGERVVGSTLYVNGIRFTVVGELKSVSALEGGVQENNCVYIPLGTGQHRIFGTDDLYWMAVRVRDSRQLPAAKDQATQALRQSRHIRSGKDDDFIVAAPDDYMAFINGYLQKLVAVLGIVAVISLVVGGVGVMNIMLVSVAERTHEIGLRKALGATRLEILWQFLIEAMTLTTVGGLLGILAGLGLANAVGAALQATLKFSWAPQVPFDWIGAVYGFSLLLGLLFGVYPASRAARLDPIKAMHSE
jgi:putative ABC transport system permease protein